MIVCLKLCRDHEGETEQIQNYTKTVIDQQGFAKAKA